MKTFIIFLVAIGLGSVVATVWIGSALQEDTVVAQPYEEGLRYDEARRAKAAAAGLGDTAALPARSAHGRGKPLPSPSADREPGGGQPAAPSGRGPTGASRDAVTLSISPDPPRAMTELTFTVGVRRDGVPVEAADVEVGLDMPGMYMGENRVVLAPAGGGTYRGTGTVVRCPSGKRAWQATVSARPAEGPPLERRFTFEVADR